MYLREGARVGNAVKGISLTYGVHILVARWGSSSQSREGWQAAGVQGSQPRLGTYVALLLEVSSQRQTTPKKLTSIAFLAVLLSVFLQPTIVRTWGLSFTQTRVVPASLYLTVALVPRQQPCLVSTLCILSWSHVPSSITKGKLASAPCFPYPLHP
ncbi:hypothetical protein GGR55DRAFT_108975 [Xylaria sp. FL0064]|nr:hypothetical protein GGR55DRAFT_108975 [Xylaria sp. FL0064]